MNCRPGDLALMLYHHNRPDLAGRLVEVLYRAPIGRFTLPDGWIGLGAPTGWVVASLGSPFKAILGNGDTRETMYGVAIDAYLRPLRDGDVETTDRTTPCETVT